MKTAGWLLFLNFSYNNFSQTLTFPEYLDYKMRTLFFILKPKFDSFLRDFEKDYERIVILISH